MNALTVWQPWAWAIAHAGKPFENRTWRPPAWLKGKRLAIHAAKRPPDAEEIAGLNSTLAALGSCLFVPADYHLGAVVAVATLYGSTSTVPADHPMRQWWVPGQIAWILTDVVTLDDPVACRGYQKIWSLPAEAERTVRQQLEIIDGDS